MEPGNQTVQKKKLANNKRVAQHYKAKALKCVFLNADTLSNKLSELQFLIDSETPQIIGINEVLPKNFTRQIFPEEFSITNYEMIAHPNVEKNSGRGTIMYIHKNINYKQIEIKINDEQFQ